MGNRKDYEENEPAAQGQQGSKTHARFVEQQNEGQHRESREDRAQHDRDLAGRKGGRRLIEDREQHDEAEKNSEHTQGLRDKE